MSIEDDFYATLKFKCGEEVFAKVAASEEEGRTMLVVHNPIIVCEVRGKSGIVGYKVEPWLKTTREDMFIINLIDVLTLSESNDLEMIMLHQNFCRDTQKDMDSKSKLDRKMGYLSTVRDAKENLEKIFKNSPKEEPKSSPD
jgi:HJR/Mrr/RecB family endonuclease